MLRAVRAVQPLLRRATAGQPLRRLSAQPKQPRGVSAASDAVVDWSLEVK